MFRLCLLIFGSIVLIPSASSDGSSPLREILTSGQKYGPDGPWQAVRVSLGSPPQLLDLYPGGTYETIILTQAACNASFDVTCGIGGLFNQTASTSLVTYPISTKGSELDWTLGTMDIRGEADYNLEQLTLSPTSTLGSVTVPNISCLMVNNAATTYADGTTYPLQIGQLALGPSNPGGLRDQNKFSLPSGANLVPGYLWTSGTMGSASYGLHIGSAALNIPLSLWLGGYDESRVIQPVNTLPSHNDFLDNFFIDLVDIGIGVDNGGSPFPYMAKVGLLAEGNSSLNSPLSVNLNPAAPYLYLPRSTCDAIAKELPVSYQPKFGLYFWDVKDPRYHDIVTSPSYLTFAFRASNRQLESLTIKVPFALLNLTLDQPLVDFPTSYFPCQPPQASSTFALGRAFLQAAFIGGSWNEDSGHWYLAQAPGPDIPTTASPLLYAETINGSSTQWSDTWKIHWTPLSDAQSKVIEKSSPSSTVHRISKGAYAGIGIGSAAAIGIATLAFILLWRHRRRSKNFNSFQSTKVKLGLQESVKTDQEIYEAAEPEPKEIYSGKQEQAWEMPHHDRTPELA
ncbi:MAG: hypothetical protein Q9224_002748 [Gallowayella concinna]